MKFSQSLSLAALAAFAAADAEWLPMEGRSGEFARINQVEAPPRFRHPALDNAAAARKYAASVPEHVVAAEKEALKLKGRVGNNPSGIYGGDREYLSPVNYGGQTLNVEFDTGSSDIWVFSSRQPAAARKGHTAYKCPAPLVAGEKWQIVYGDGSSASGVVKKDTVRVGSLTVTGQAVECATHVAAQFKADKKIDGIFGLGFLVGNQAHPRKINNWFLNIKSRLQAPLFTAYLRHKKPGSYDFGYIDPSKHSGPIKYTPASGARGYWEIHGQGYAVGSGGKKSIASTYIVDTGTSITYVPNAAAAAYWKKVPGAVYVARQGGYLYPCKSKLPSFSVYTGGARHTVPGQYIHYLTFPGGTQCFGGIQPAGRNGIPFGILGDTFIKAQFTVFDAAGPKVGFAPRK